MCGDVMTCAGTCSQAQSHEPPQKLEELRQLKRGFPGFLLSTKVKKNLIMGIAFLQRCTAKRKSIRGYHKNTADITLGAMSAV